MIGKCAYLGGYMNYVVAVFKSRSEAMSFYAFLSRNQVPCRIVPTPKEAGRTCGLSVKFMHSDFSKVKSLFASVRFVSFQGFYLISDNR